jgi:hypothetical protein
MSDYDRAPYVRKLPSLGKSLAHFFQALDRCPWPTAVTAGRVSPHLKRNIAALGNTVLRRGFGGGRRLRRLAPTASDQSGPAETISPAPRMVSPL